MTLIRLFELYYYCSHISYLFSHYNDAISEGYSLQVIQALYEIKAYYRNIFIIKTSVLKGMYVM